MCPYFPPLRSSYLNKIKTKGLVSLCTRTYLPFWIISLVKTHTCSSKCFFDRCKNNFDTSLHCLQKTDPYE